MNGKCLVFFLIKYRKEFGVIVGDTFVVTLELDARYRNVDVLAELESGLKAHNLTDIFTDLTYSKRKEYARQVAEAKAEDTKQRRIDKIITELKGE